MVLQVGDGDREGLSRVLFFLCLIFIGFLLMFLDGLDGRFRRIDIDDALRRIEVIQLLADSRWFDRTLDAIRMPEPYVSPWSRLVDLPYVLLTWMIEPFVERQGAVNVAFLIWPPVLFMVFSLLATAILFRVKRDGSRGVPFWQLVAMVILAAPAILEFEPGRIDHHNVQILLLLFFVYGVLRDDVAGGFLAGVVVAASPMVGLECLPLMAVGAGAIVLAWCIAGLPRRGFTLVFLLACASATLFLGGLLVGARGLFATQCDNFSAPFAFALTALPLVTGLVILILPSELEPRMRILAVGGAALPVLLCGAFLFSECLAGPYGIIDPVSHRYWFSRVRQEGNIGAVFEAGYAVEVVRLALLAAVIVAAGIKLARENRPDLAETAIAWATACAALLLALAMFRYTPIAASVGPIFLPLAASEVLRLWSGRGKGRLALWMAGAAMLGLALGSAAKAASATATGPDAVDYMNEDGCEGADFADLSRLTTGRILAPPGLALAIAGRMQPGVSVAGILFHRASPGLRRTYETLLSEDNEVRREALAPFDYVAVCRRVLPAGGEPAPLFRALAGGDDWPGLSVVGEGKSAFRLLRVDHEAFR